MPDNQHPGQNKDRQGQGHGQDQKHGNNPGRQNNPNDPSKGQGSHQSNDKSSHNKTR